MRGINRILIVGRLGAEPETKISKTGASWCKFSVATNRAHKRGEEWVEETDWHEIRVFGDEGVRCQDKLHKGNVVALEGTLQYDSWTEEDGRRRRKARITAHRVQLVVESRARAAAAEQELSEPTLELPSPSPLPPTG